MWQTLSASVCRLSATFFHKETTLIHRITTRLNEEEFNYLKDISIKNNLYTNDTNHISIGKALKAILEWCKK